MCSAQLRYKYHLILVLLTPVSFLPLPHQILLLIRVYDVHNLKQGKALNGNRKVYINTTILQNEFSCSSHQP